MKRIIFLLLFLPGAVLSFAENYDFSALQGLKDENGDIWFEMAGYEIYTTVCDGNLESLSSIDALKKAYKITDIQAEYSEPLIPTANKVIEVELLLERNPFLKRNDTYFLIQKPAGKLSLILFQTFNQRDIFLEQAFVNAFLNDSLTEYISDDWETNSISFVGRTIELEDACVWQYPHDLYSKGGQISWSEFSSPVTADLDLDARIMADNREDIQILSEEYLDILFENIPTEAYRIAYKMENDDLPLIVYYVMQEVRGRFISCVMRNYGYSMDDYELSPLIQQFMSIPVLPEWAYNQLDEPEYEPFEREENERLSFLPNIEVRPVTILPLGNLSKIFKAAPGFDAFICVPIRKKTTVDFGLLLAFPVKSSAFDFNLSDEIYETKIVSFLSLNLRYAYHHKLSKGLTCKSYFGVSGAMLQTDLLKEENEEGENTYYSIESLNLLCGVSLIYKHVGCFLEYHTPYATSNTKEIPHNFGGNFLNVGLTWRFFSF
ncbi:MAG: hypothetical protein LBU22_07765 [Dysgonamonadaceae bacterium]|jgi:hypothetical protein|nr:hypothetical protein [Dysgonamonadaceae bacterium]